MNQAQKDFGLAQVSIHLNGPIYSFLHPGQIQLCGLKVLNNQVLNNSVMSLNTRLDQNLHDAR
ncbi:hypothetical protein Hanom_Chr16g01506481 [Helianthus anomalus]